MGSSKARHTAQVFSVVFANAFSAAFLVFFSLSAFRGERPSVEEIAAASLVALWWVLAVAYAAGGWFRRVAKTPFKWMTVALPGTIGLIVLLSRALVHPAAGQAHSKSTIAIAFFGLAMSVFGAYQLVALGRRHRRTSDP